LPIECRKDVSKWLEVTQNEIPKNRRRMRMDEKWEVIWDYLAQDEVDRVFLRLIWEELYPTPFTLITACT
jgi:hypothetical protein